MRLRQSWTAEYGLLGVSDASVDHQSSILVSGRFQGTKDFDPTIGTDIRSTPLDPQGFPESYDLFVSKLHADGTYAWTYSVGSKEDDTAYAITVDSVGNFYAAGQFSDTMDFDPGPEVFELEVLAPYAFDGFLLKLSSDGKFLWARSFLPDFYISPQGMRIDSEGNIILAGGPGDITVAKLNPQDQTIWHLQIGGSANDGATAVALDNNDAILLYGTFRGTVDFDPGPGVDFHTAQSQPDHILDDIFVTKLHSDGSYAWTRTLPTYDGGINPHIAVDQDGAVYFGGLIAGGTVDMDPTDSTDLRTALPGENNMFLSKLNSDGSYGWTHMYGTRGNVKSIVAAPDGYLYATGSFRGTVDFDTGPAVDTQFSAGTSDIFLMKFLPDGSHLWAMTFGGPDGDGGTDLALDPAGSLFFVGAFQGAVDINPSCVVDFHGAGQERRILISRFDCLDLTGDFDLDGDVDLRDLAAFQNCFRGPGSRSCSHGCDAFDLHPDLALDLLDFSLVSPSVTGPQQ